MHRLLFMLLFSLPFMEAMCQNEEIINQLRKTRDPKLLNEIEKQVEQLIYNSPAFLGKTQYELIDQTKPAELGEYLFPWNDNSWIELSEENKKVFQGIFRMTFRNALSISIYIPQH